MLRAVFATALINVVFNAAIAWLSVQGQDGVPTWGVPLAETSLFWNAIGTLFLLPLITCVLTTTAIRHDIGAGAVEPVPWLHSAYPRTAALPAGRLARGVILGALAVLALGPLVTLALAVAGSPELGDGEFIAAQTAFAVLLGALVTPPIGLLAMADPT